MSVETLLNQYPTEIEVRDLTELNPHPQNPNLHPEEQLEELSHLLKKYGYLKVSISIQESTNTIIAGHGMVEAHLRLGILKQQVNVVDCPDDIALAFLLADNRSTIKSYFDVEKEKEAVVILYESPDIELKDILFTDAEYEALLPDFEPGDVEEQSRLDQKSQVTCPECGHEFIPK